MGYFKQVTIYCTVSGCRKIVVLITLKELMVNISVLYSTKSTAVLFFFIFICPSFNKNNLDLTQLLAA